MAIALCIFLYSIICIARVASFKKISIVIKIKSKSKLCKRGTKTKHERFSLQNIEKPYCTGDDFLVGQFFSPTRIEIAFKIRNPDRKDFNQLHKRRNLVLQNVLECHVVSSNEIGANILWWYPSLGYVWVKKYESCHSCGSYEQPRGRVHFVHTRMRWRNQ